jgi:hypothetical protein
MNGTRDTDQTGGADNGGELDPRQAATLLEQTTQQARRRLEPYPPWLTAIRGILVLAACGTVWLSVRGQHPYQHPGTTAVVVVIAFGVLNLGVTLAVARRRTSGVSGRSRLHPYEIAIMALTWVVPYVVMGFLPAAGVSNATAYGLYPITVPLIVAGLATAGIMAARADWRRCGTAAAVAVVGAVGLFAGPAGAWAVAGIGLCLVLLGTAAVVTRQQHA